MTNKDNIQKKEGNYKLIRLIPVMLALAFVPLIATVKRYDNGLTGFSWFSNASGSVDIFLYWKGQALILLAFLMMAFLLLSCTEWEWMPQWRAIRKPPVICLLIYFVLATLSALFSEHRNFALTGSYEQWEGLNVILAYVMLFLYISFVLGEEKQVRFLIYALIAGSFIMGLIGTFQYMGMDLFRGDFGQVLMNLMSDTKMKFSFNFADGWVYATLYNPNYVGSYAALVLPVLIAVSLIEWKRIPPVWTLMAMVDSCLMVVTLIGSQSLTGCIGVIAGGLLFLVVRVPVFFRKIGMKKILLVLGVAVVLIAGAAIAFRSQIQYGVNKIFHPTKDTYVTKSLLSTKEGLKVTTVQDESFYVQLTEGDSGTFTVTDENGEALTTVQEEESEGCTIDDSRFSGFVLYPKTVTVSNERAYSGVRIVNPTVSREWTVFLSDGTYKIFNSLGKVDSLREIPAWGFEGAMHFASKRGYLWSRTIPLLKKYLFLGSGPDNFTTIFPNDDYVGKMNMDYDGVTVTKPHNMYFQIWTQTGLLSLIAVLCLVVWYLVKSLRLYWGRTLAGTTEHIGFALMISIFGYMVTGLANDSTVAVAPVFWGLLAVGIAVNEIVEGQKV